jgi:Ras-related protein Rab-1A
MNQHNYSKIIKIVLLGDANVGKSNIMGRLIKDEFTRETASTIGVEFSLKNIIINDTRYKVQLWDTAGQERFRSVIRSYYRGCHGIILVYDITNRDSFNNIEKWLTDINNNCGNKQLQIILVGSKIDLEKDRKVLYNEGKQLAESKNIKFIEISSLYNTNNLSNIHNMINSILNDILDNTDEDEYGKNDNNTIILNTKYTNNVTTINDKKCCTI